MTTRRNAVQSRLPAALRREVSSKLRAHLHLHLPSSSKRNVSLVEGLAANRRMRPEHLFSVVATLQAYSATLIQLSRCRTRDATFSGYVLLVEGPQRENLLIEISTPKGATPALRVVSGPTVQFLRKALAKASTMPKSKPSELRILRIPALHLSALWHSIPGKENKGWFVPYGANTANVKPARAYGFLTFQKRVQSAATQLILRWYERHQEEQLRKTLPVERARGTTRDEQLRQELAEGS